MRCTEEQLKEPHSFVSLISSRWGHEVAQWLRHYATNQKIAGSIPDEENF
jgi:hypothetical protein